MSPEPYVRGQAAALAAALLAAAVLGSPIAALACTAAVALGAAVLYLRYRGDLREAGIEVGPPRQRSTPPRKTLPQHRERPDLLVAGDLRAALALGAVAGAFMLAFHIERPDLGIAPVTAVLLAVTAAVVLLSSLIDWYVILPRVSGLLGIRPCREPDTDFPRRPETWREVTRWWYVHRIVAALVLRFGLSLAVSLTVALYVDVPYGAGIVAGAAVGGFLSAYAWAVPKAAWQAGHLTLVVGQTVERHAVDRVPWTITVFSRTVAIPFLTRPVAGPVRPREYVYDVAIEGVQLVPAAQREGEEILRNKKGEVSFARHQHLVKIPIRDVDTCSPDPADPFAGCRDRCSGINWYCIENRRCFMNK